MKLSLVLLWQRLWIILNIIELTGLWKMGPITLDVGAASNVWLVPPNFELSFKIMLWIVDLSGEKVPSLCLLLIFFCSTNWVGTFNSVQVILFWSDLFFQQLTKCMTTDCLEIYLLWTSFCSGSGVQIPFRYKVKVFPFFFSFSNIFAG